MTMQRRPKPYRPRPVHLNAVQIAMRRAAALLPEDVAQQMALVRTAIDEFKRGLHCAHHWRSIADTANMAETIAAMGIGAGPQADQVIAAAQQVLYDVHHRHTQRRTWTLHASELEALEWLAALHRTQLQAISYGEFDQALTRTTARMRQALAGNAAPGVMVVAGDVGAIGA